MLSKLSHIFPSSPFCGVRELIVISRPRQSKMLTKTTFMFNISLLKIVCLLFFLILSLLRSKKKTEEKSRSRSLSPRSLPPPHRHSRHLFHTGEGEGGGRKRVREGGERE